MDSDSVMRFSLTVVSFWIWQCQDGKLRVLSLFTGIAGFECGLGESGAEFEFHMLVSSFQVHVKFGLRARVRAMFTLTSVLP